MLTKNTLKLTAEYLPLVSFTYNKMDIHKNKVYGLFYSLNTRNAIMSVILLMGFLRETVCF